MITSKIKKEELDDFYQSKFEYYRNVSGYSAMLIALLEMTYFVTDCQIFGRFAYETLVPRFFIAIPLLIFWYFYPQIQTYKLGTLCYYIFPHAAMWCTIWAIWYLPNRDFAREGFIIMHFAFLAIGIATPLKYHIIFHACLLLNIVISNMWNHYEAFSLMITLALPLYIGVVLMLYILENSYADQYLIKKKLEYSSISDELTGAFNRHKLDELVDKSTGRFTFSKNTVLLMLDIDYFKKVNDTYGHEAGDEILKFVVSEIKNQVYGKDYIIRWGGEEFIILLVDYTADQALRFAEKLRASIESSDNGICPVTISVGLCRYNRNENYHDTIDKADQALYYAKDHGRNQVVNYADMEK
ncbi:MAG: GGDEF domain-containing protein [Pseudobutyrivibrio sp.]|nr:GGDEF domain-containing protein [Pseudobutyrivibrio sp.]